jgi:hypothetical protein
MHNPVLIIILQYFYLAFSVLRVCELLVFQPSGNVGSLTLDYLLILVSNTP